MKQRLFVGIDDALALMILPLKTGKQTWGYHIDMTNENVYTMGLLSQTDGWRMCHLAIVSSHKAVKSE